MRLRLTVLLMFVFTSLLVILAVPQSVNIAHGEQQQMFADRLQDAVRMAGVAQQAGTPVDAQELDDQLARYSELYGVSTALVTRSGTVERQHGSAFHADDPAVQGPLNVALGGHPSRDDRAVWPWQHWDMVVAVPVMHGGDVAEVVVTVSSTAELRAGVRDKLLKLAAGAHFALLGSVLLVTRLSRWVLRPVDELDLATEEIARGRLQARVRAVDGPPELRRLAESFNRMADRVEQMMDHQIAFVADASHQLRTPLTTLTLRIESMEAQADPIRTHEFEALSDEVQRLSSILSSLLHLAAVDQVQPALQEIDIGALIRCRLQSWRPQATARQVVISRDTDTAPDQPVIVLTDPTLFGSALDAVLDNGIKFSPPQGTVTVRIHPETDVVRCVVSDDGAGLLPGEFDRIGGRFWRSMRHQNVDGTGLGLAIVRTLQEAVGGEVSFAPNTPSGLSVTLTLPLAGAWKPGPAAEPRTRGAGACLERIVARPDHRNEGVLR